MLPWCEHRFLPQESAARGRKAPWGWPPTPPGEGVLFLRALITVLLVLATLSPAFSQQPTAGPSKVTLDGGKATIDLPKGWLYFGKADTQKILQETGNVPDDTDIAIVTTGDADDAAWFVVSYDPMGYVKDDEAGQLDAKAILEDIREGTEAANEVRKEQGVTPIHVAGWAEEPRYDSQSHTVVWAIIGESDGGKTVNYNTRVLGREGVLSLNMVTGLGQLERDKPSAQQLLKGTSYVVGQRYQDFKEGDKVSEVGLMALVAGGAAAAAKTGLLAKLGKLVVGFFLVFKKGAVLIVVGFFALVGKLFGRKGSEQQEQADAQTDSDHQAS